VRFYFYESDFSVVLERFGIKLMQGGELDWVLLVGPRRIHKIDCKQIVDGDF
jgi:hypothetical protein